MRGRKRLRKKKERAIYVGAVYAAVRDMLTGSNIQCEKATMSRIRPKTRRAIMDGFKRYCDWYKYISIKMPKPQVEKRGNRLDITMYLAPDEATHQRLHEEVIPHEHVVDFDSASKVTVVADEDMPVY
jgi:hypothetical protein